MLDKSRKLLQAIAVRWRRNSARGAAMTDKHLDAQPDVEIVKTEKRPPIPLFIPPRGPAVWPTRALLFPMGYAEHSVASRHKKS
jgi:hypothetical protein